MKIIIDLLNKNSDRAFGGKYKEYSISDPDYGIGIDAKIVEGDQYWLDYYDLNMVDMLTELVKLIWGDEIDGDYMSSCSFMWQYCLQQWVLIEDIAEREKQIEQDILDNQK